MKKRTVKICLVALLALLVAYSMFGAFEPGERLGISLIFAIAGALFYFPFSQDKEPPTP